MSKKKILNYNKGDYEKLQTYFNVDWEERFENKSAQECMDLIEETYKHGVTECIPTNTFETSRQDKPLWLNFIHL